MKVNVKYCKLYRKRYAGAKETVHQSVQGWFIFCQRLSLPEAWATEVTRLQLHKTNLSLVFRNYLDSFSFPFSSFLSSFLSSPSSLVPSCDLHTGCPAKPGALHPWRPSRQDGIGHGPGQPALAGPALVWASCPAGPSEWTILGFHLTGCYARQDAVAKRSVQSHKRLDFPSLWGPPLYHTPLSSCPHS